MGSHAGAVLDERLRVRGGVTGLRVADASVMPGIVSGNTNAPTMMIGSKAAAMIIEDNRPQRRKPFADFPMMLSTDGKIADKQGTMGYVVGIVRCEATKRTLYTPVPLTLFNT
ncbi:hypothetical protein MTO96_047577 [Rhipicephalus appendiculatus]